MIVKEFFSTRFDGMKLYRIYSDKGFKIRQTETENIYDEAIDIESASWTYTESDIPIDDSYEKDEISKKADAWDELTGGTGDE